MAKNNKYNKPVKVDLEKGFSFDSFVGSVAKADPKQVDEKLKFQDYLEEREKVLAKVKVNEDMPDEVKKDVIGKILKQIERIETRIKEIESGK